MDKINTLWGYKPEEPVSDEVRRVYGLIFPLFHEYVLGELLGLHVEKGRRDALRDDVQKRLDRLFAEARFCVATAVPDTVGTWWIEHRRHRFEALHRDLRRRRRKLPAAMQLLQEYEPLRATLRKLLPRRREGQQIPDRSLRIIQELYPELGWRDVADAQDKTPADTAHKVLAARHDVSPGRVKRALEQARRESRG